MNYNLIFEPNKPIMQESKADLYDAFYQGRGNAPSYYDRCFPRSSAERLLPMERDILQRSINLALPEEGPHISKIKIVNFGSGNGRELIFYMDLAAGLQHPCRSHITDIDLVLYDISSEGLRASKEILLQAGFYETSQDCASNSHTGADTIATLHNNGNFSVRLVLGKAHADPSDIAANIGQCDIVHSVFGVFSSICDEAKIVSSMKMLSEICTGHALFTVASEGDFPTELRIYDEFRAAGLSGPLYAEEGVISYVPIFPDVDGNFVSLGSERYKLFNFFNLSALSEKGGWNVKEKMAVTTQSLMNLTHNKNLAEQNSLECHSLNMKLNKLKGEQQEAFQQELAKKAKYIGAILTPYN